MKKKAEVHLFLCERGEVLPRWGEAFRAAHAVPAGSVSPAQAQAELVWLRLAPEMQLQAQVRQLPAALRERPLVVLSDLPSDLEALAAFAAGARGYCNTHAAPAVLRQVATVVLQGGLWIGESLMQRLVGATARAPVPEAARVADPRAWAERLTERERQVATTLAQGASNKEIARALGITERTVKAHVGAVLEKLQVRDRLQLSLIVTGRAAPPESPSDPV